jgi:hypothetical protein
MLPKDMHLGIAEVRNTEANLGWRGVWSIYTSRTSKLQNKSEGCANVYE